MSLNFKTDLKEMRENNPAGEDGLEADYKASENYDAPGHVRNLCFVWPDGRMKFMNYAYLVSGEYLPDSSSIKLVFTSSLILIQGINLIGLFNDILFNKAKIAYCNNTRYNLLIQTNDYTITDIQIVNE